MAAHRHTASALGVLELTMAPNLLDLDPAEGLKHRDDLSHFHASTKCKRLAVCGMRVRRDFGEFGALDWRLGDLAVIAVWKNSKDDARRFHEPALPFLVTALTTPANSSTTSIHPASSELVGGSSYAC